MTLRRTNLFSGLFCVTALLLSAISAGAQATRNTKVLLAATTFTPTAFKELQPVADQVATIVDELIPGTPPDYPVAGIVCFEAPARWSSVEYRARGFASPPATIGGPRVYDEPIESVGNRVRIVVHDVQAPDKFRFAYQLSHELAHVKMGVRSDNYLNETFAVALSFEVLRRLGYEGYMLINEGVQLHELPPEPQKLLALGQWREVQIYWLAHSKLQGLNIEDRAFQTLGAMLILRNGRTAPHWAELLNASSTNVCEGPSLPSGAFRVCDPDLAKMRKQRSFLRALGYQRKQVSAK